MLDALVPALDAARSAVEAGATGHDAAVAARDAAATGAASTIPMLATKGRASYLGERSIGHQDPGATSSAMLLAALVEAIEADGR
jgi:dihydroxyacetone kinase-like protein